MLGIPLIAVILAYKWMDLFEKQIPMDSCDESKASQFQRQLFKYDEVDARFDLDHESLLGECVFRQTYDEARLLFRNSAEAAGFTTSVIPIHDSYQADIAILKGDPKKVLIHISGIHGVEGYAGSGAQVAALQYFALKNTTRRALYTSLNDEGGKTIISPPTLVFIHAINPFGMSNNRRVNEQNIDVNRNFLSDEQLAFTRNRDPNFAGYVDIDFLLNFPILNKNIFLSQYQMIFLLE